MNNLDCNLKDPTQYKICDPRFEQYLKNNSSALLKVCSKMTKYQTGLSTFALKILNENFKPMLETAVQKGKFDLYHSFKAKLLISNANTEILKDLSTISEIKNFLRNYSHKPTEKMRKQLYKLAETIKKCDPKGETDFSQLIKQQIKSHGNNNNTNTIEINPILWLANIPNTGLYHTLFEPTAKQLSLNDTTIKVLNYYVLSIDINRNSSINIFSDLIASFTPESCLEFLEEIEYLQCPDFCDLFYKLLVTAITPESVMRITVISLKYNHKELMKNCFDFIQQATRLIFSCRPNGSLYVDLPAAEDEGIKSVFESLSDFIGGIGVLNCASLQSVNNHLLEKNLPLKQVHSVCYDTDEPFTEETIAYLKNVYPNLKVIFISNFSTINDNITLLEPTAEKYNIVLHLSNTHTLHFNCIKNKSIITDDVISAIASVRKNLLIIYLNGCTQITIDSIKLIAQENKNLRFIHLSGCTQITDTTIQLIVEKCTNLTGIDLSGCTQITDAAIQPIAQNCTKLRMINLSSCTQITDASIQKLIQASPNLEVLCLTSIDALTNETLKLIGKNLGKLKKLDLSSTVSIEAIESLKKTLPNCTIVQAPAKRESPNDDPSTKKSKLEELP